VTKGKSRDEKSETGRVRLVITGADKNKPEDQVPGGGGQTTETGGWQGEGKNVPGKTS